MAKIFAAANAHDTVAYMAFFEHSPSLIFAFDGRVVRGWNVLSSIWKRLPVGWRIVYCHESWMTPPG